MNDHEKCRAIYLHNLSAGRHKTMPKLIIDAGEAIGYETAIYVMASLIAKGEVEIDGSTVSRPSTIAPQPKKDDAELPITEDLFLTLRYSAITAFDSYVYSTDDVVLSTLLSAHIAAQKLANEFGEQVSFEALDSYINGKDVSEVLSLLWHAKINAEAALEEFNKESPDVAEAALEEFEKGSPDV